MNQREDARRALRLLFQFANPRLRIPVEAFPEEVQAKVEALYEAASKYVTPEVWVKVRYDTLEENHPYRQRISRKDFLTRVTRRFQHASELEALRKRIAQERQNLSASKKEVS